MFLVWFLGILRQGVMAMFSSVCYVSSFWSRQVGIGEILALLGRAGFSNCNYWSWILSSSLSSMSSLSSKRTRKRGDDGAGFCI